MKTKVLFAVCAMLVVSASAVRAHGPGADMAEAAHRFLQALNPDQRQQATFELNADERFNWHFIPRERKGLSIQAMTAEQRPLAHALLASGLSQRGYLKAATIITLEAILRDLEQGRGPNRDPELYFVSIFGKPDAHGTWGWRFEGHHLSLNFTIVEGHHISATPSFLGSNPAEVRSGPRKGLRTLAAEEDLARELVRSLNPEQQRIAIYTNVAPRDIITGADRKARLLKPDGLSIDKMNREQADLLWRLIEEYIHRAHPEIAQEEVQEIKRAGKIFFAWAGSTEPGQGHYYRIQGPTFLLEYDNTQNNANHVHAVWRDLKNDFGEDLLREHYRRDHSGQ